MPFKGNFITPIIIPVFLPNAGCQERCLFCNQKVTSNGLPSPSSVRDFVQDSLRGLPSDKKNGETQVAFYGGSFTAIGKEDQVSYLEAIQSFLASGRINSIRISTRPDALDAEILSLLKKYGVKTVEIGAQSMIDQVLFLANRGHSAQDTFFAASQLKQWGFEGGLQLMIGLPGDTVDRFLETLDQIIDLKPDFVKVPSYIGAKGVSS